MQRLGYCAKALTQRMSGYGTSLAGIPHYTGGAGLAETPTVQKADKCFGLTKQ